MSQQKLTIYGIPNLAVYLRRLLSLTLTSAHCTLDFTSLFLPIARLVSLVFVPLLNLIISRMSSTFRHKQTTCEDAEDDLEPNKNFLSLWVHISGLFLSVKRASFSYGSVRPADSPVILEAVEDALLEPLVEPIVLNIVSVAFSPLNVCIPGFGRFAMLKSCIEVSV